MYTGRGTGSEPTSQVHTRLKNPSPVETLQKPRALLSTRRARRRQHYQNVFRLHMHLRRRQYRPRAAGSTRLYARRRRRNPGLTFRCRPFPRTAESATAPRHQNRPQSKNAPNENTPCCCRQPIHIAVLTRRKDKRKHEARHSGYAATTTLIERAPRRPTHPQPPRPQPRAPWPRRRRRPSSSSPCAAAAGRGSRWSSPRPRARRPLRGCPARTAPGRAAAAPREGTRRNRRTTTAAAGGGGGGRDCPRPPAAAPRRRAAAGPRRRSSALLRKGRRC